jgi:hypothetical protein
MSDSFTLVDGLALRDLQVFLGRAERVENGSVRLIASGRVLAVYVAALYPIGLLDETPTVLGLRTLALAEDATFDTVVPVRSLAERVTRKLDQGAAEADAVSLTLPLAVNTVTWTAISPPRGGWLTLEPTDAALLEQAAKAGIEEVAAAIPAGTGEQIVHRVRSEVWGRPIEGLEHVPAGAGFAAVTLGFLAEGEPVTVHETGPWTRLTTKRGHVLVRRRAWTLTR